MRPPAFHTHSASLNMRDVDHSWGEIAIMFMLGLLTLAANVFVWVPVIVYAWRWWTA